VHGAAYPQAAASSRKVRDFMGGTNTIVIHSFLCYSRLSFWNLVHRLNLARYVIPFVANTSIDPAGFSNAERGKNERNRDSQVV
jgi:hypothetical protein